MSLTAGDVNLLAFLYEGRRQRPRVVVWLAHKAQQEYWRWEAALKASRWEQEEPVRYEDFTVAVALEPELLPGDPGLFAARLAYDHRDVEEELAFVELTRKQMARILRALKPEDFQRFGLHSRDGALTLEDLLQRVTGHIPHHVQFIEEKRRALA